MNMKKSLLTLLVIPALCAGVYAAYGASQPDSIRPGSKVFMHYTMTVDGQLIESTDGKEPLEFVHGTGDIIPGLDRRLFGLEAGEVRTVILTPAEGYGARDPRAVRQVPLSRFGELARGLEIGMKVSGLRGGEIASGTVLSLDGDSVTLDFNHPRAGKTVHFFLRIVSLVND